MSRLTLEKRESKIEIRDKKLKEEILGLRKKHKRYGGDRIYLKLKAGRNRVFKVLRKYDMQLNRKRLKPFKPEDKGNLASKVPNLLENLKVISPNTVWASDFTYLRYENSFFYVATFIDIFSRKIVGFNISDKHDTELILKAFYLAVTKEKTVPCIVHSDQGSEYRSERFTSVLKYHQISQSMSPKGCPWRNGFQESYYRGFKEDLGDISCCNSIGELVSRVRETINYYNTERMHTALKASPNEFLAAYYQQTA